MILSALILFTLTMAGGLLVTVVGYRSDTIKLPLLFAGSFLFAITIIHILPEVFTLSAQPFKIGLFVLAGFFFQQLLEFLTNGIEHGHFHGQKSSMVSRFNILMGLFVHSLLEGALLTHDSPFHHQHESYSLLVGIILHKAPAAFALMAVFKTSSDKFSYRQLLILIFFSAASPAGLFLSNYLTFFSSEGLFMFFAFVSGNFLHISTTIFVETSPQHQFRLNRILISILGASLAIASEYLV